MQTVLSSTDEKKISIEKLIQIPVDKVKEKLLHLGSEERIRYAGKLFEGNGWTVAYHKRGQQADSILLSYPKSPDNIVLMVRLDASPREISYEEVREQLLYFENELAPQYQCRQFCLIAINGYESKAEHLEDFNLLLQKWSYIEELHLNYSSDKIREPRIQLFAHNKQTYKKVQRMMQQTNAVAVVQATGTGKSYLIAKLLQDFNGTKRLVMAPSTFIIEQIKEHIRWEVDKIQFMTYAKGMNLSESEIKALQPGMIVLDEFHRCGADEWGRGVQNIINAFPSAFKFGTSATPIRYLDNRRDMAKELFEGNIAENLSLAQAITRNILPMPKYVCALYTLKEEADNMRELIKKSRKNEEAKQKLLLELDTLTLDWDRSHGIPQVLKKHLRKHMSKFIVFCENEKHLLETEPMVVGWFKEATENLSIKTYRIYDNEPKSNEILEAFKNVNDKDAIHLLFSINMLNEGLHVNEVSGVVLLRPTASPNIFYQQIGRCLKVGASHTPVIFDFVNNFKSVRTHDFMYDLQEAKRFFAETRKEQDLKDLCPEFSIIDEVREITEVFGEIEFRVDDWEAMYERLVEFKKRFGHCNVPKEWEEDTSLARWLYNQRRKHKDGLLQKQLAQKMTELGVEWKLELLVGSLDALWMKQFEALCEFREIYGHCNPGKKHEKYGHLNAFVQQQRKRYKAETLEEYRIKKLESVGFEWSPFKFEEGQWQQYFDELIAFKNKRGHCNISFKSYTPLGYWATQQRESFKKNVLDPARQHKLNSIGFNWEEKQIVRKTWNEQYATLLSFYNQHGNSLLPTEEQYQSLNGWCSKQRMAYKKGQLSSTRIENLNAIRFVWDFDAERDKIWEQRYEEMCAFKAKHGHCRVPQGKDVQILARWCRTMRMYYQNKTLSEYKIKRLEVLGFSWDVLEDQWQNNYEKLKQFMQQNTWKDLFSKDRSLFGWANLNRKNFREGKLAEDKIILMNQLAIEWTPMKSHWDSMYQQLAEYYKKHGTSRVAVSDKKNKTLGMWCGSQRKNYRQNILSPEQTKLLNDIQFPWKPGSGNLYGKMERMEPEWQMMYSRLVEYKKQYGQTMVPTTDLKHKTLSNWCRTQQRNYHKNILLPRRIKHLENIGFEWDLTMNLQWKEMYSQLVDHKNKNGSAYVPTGDTGLGRWCATQRKNYQTNQLHPDRIKLLNEIGFLWEYNVYDPIWQAKFDQLVKFKAEFGTTRVTESAKQYPGLAIWSEVQRKRYRQNKLEPERVKQLNDIGFAWEVPNDGGRNFSWRKWYPQLVQYHKTTGKGWVDASQIATNKSLKHLYQWCSKQRSYYWENRLTPEEIRQLEALDFPFEKGR